MKIGILTMEQYENRRPNTVGSSRIRGTWIANNMPEAELFVTARKYDAIVFQKAYFSEYIKHYDGIKVLDLCDPDWIEGKPVKEFADQCDAVTVPTEALATFMRQITKVPVFLVPDRMDLALFPKKKSHVLGRARRVAWFGYSSNQKVLDQALSAIARLGLELVVISDLPYFPTIKMPSVTDEWLTRSVKNVKYDADTINDELLACDIVINPRIESGRFKFKSNNKTLTAWALGLPVAETAEDLERFLDADERMKEAEKRGIEMKEHWDIKQSVVQYRQIIQDIANEKSVENAVR